MNGSLRIARIAGIDVKVHYTWWLAFGLITWGLARNMYPFYYPGWGTATYWTAGALSALLLFFSVLLHELAHSLVAIRRGIEVSSITLFVFGGISSIKREARSAASEFAIAIVGPVTSLLTAGAFWVAYLSTGDRGNPLAATLNYLAVVNALVAGFNMLPGFPLDGGRVFRSFLWGRTGNYTRATLIAGLAGLGFGWLLIAFGLFLIASGLLVSGIWMGILGWFLISAAAGTRRQAMAQDLFGEVAVADLMDPDPPQAAPDASLEQIATETMLRRGIRAVPVVQEGRPVGILGIGGLSRIPREQWARTLVIDVMDGCPLPTAQPSDSAARALEIMQEHDVGHLLVMRDGQLAGLVTREHLARYAELKELSGSRR